MAPRAAAAAAAEAQQLQELRSRTERAERRLLACENLVGELGSSLAALGSLLQGYGHLQRRLDNVENLLKNRNFWILRLPPGSRGEIPKVPVTFDDISVYFNEQEWERLERWQKDLYRAVMRGNYETLISLDYAVSKPDILTRLERDDELCARGGQEPPQTPEEMDQVGEALGEDEVPMEAGTDCAVPKPDILARIQRDGELCVRDGQEPPLTRVGDSQKCPQTDVPDVQKLALTGIPDSQKPPQTDAPDVQKPPQTDAPDVQKPPQTDAPDVQKPPQTGIPDAQKPPQTNVPDAQKPPQTSIPDVQKPPQTDVPDVQKPPQTNVPDVQESPQTDVPDLQESPQTPEEMDQKEKALGEDEVSMESDTEHPILMKSVTSRDARQLKLRTEEQHEAEMEEDSAASGTEEGFGTGRETMREGASANIKVKKEEPEVFQEVSAPPGMRTCPKSEKAKNKKKSSRCESTSLLMGNCRRGHVREWSHPCTECGKRFRLKINLIIHQRSHAKEGPYECSVCELSFTDKHHLDLHQSIHVKDRAFGAKVWGNVHPDLRIRPRRSCCGALCGGAHGAGGRTCAGGGPWLGQAKEEPDRGSLPNAALSQQQSPKPHPKAGLKCRLCKKVLSCPFSLQRHLRTHVRERPYCCPTCEKCFTRRTHLTRHAKIHDRQNAPAAPRQPPARGGGPAPPQPRAAPAGTSAPRRSLSPAGGGAKAVPAELLLVRPVGLGPSKQAFPFPGWGGRGIQPVVRLGSRAEVLGLLGK
ncbi:uncharacterized protein O3Q21_001808 [Podargus strigoides]